MEVRNITKEDLKIIGINESVMKHLKKGIIIDNQEYIIIKNLGGINEILWNLKPEHSLLLKATRRQLNEPIHAIEQDKTRIKILESAGFTKQKELEGIYPNTKAVILKLN